MHACHKLIVVFYFLVRESDSLFLLLGFQCHLDFIQCHSDFIHSFISTYCFEMAEMANIHCAIHLSIVSCTWQSTFPKCTKNWTHISNKIGIDNCTFTPSYTCSSLPKYRIITSVQFCRPTLWWKLFHQILDMVWLIVDCEHWLQFLHYFWYSCSWVRLW